MNYYTRNIKYTVSVWTPPMTEEFIINNISSFSNFDILHIIRYQNHLSDKFINKLKMSLEMLR